MGIQYSMTPKQRIFIFGGSNHAKLTIDILEQEGKYEICGILDSSKPVGEKVSGYQILGSIEELAALNRNQGINKGIIAIGDNYTRLKVAHQITKQLPDFEFVNAIHPSVIIGSRVHIGKGCILAAGVIVNNDCRLGDHCYMAFKSGISHDSTIGNFSSMGPGAITGGNVQIGECTAIALGAKVLNGRKIGSYSVVGSSCLVYDNVDNEVVVIGIPAREVRKREKEEPYL